MQFKFFLLLAGVIACTCSFGQKKDEINFAEPIQIDSSEYFLIPHVIDGDNRGDYGKIGYAWGNYIDISFYNAQTNQTKKLFGTTLALINSFSPERNYYREPVPEIPVNILPKHIVYLVRTEDFNKDKELDYRDNISIYISTKTGDNLRQITPKGLHVMSWILSKDKKMILAKCKWDKNKNKKFGEGDDDVYYRIDLDDDISKIKCEQIQL